LMFWNVEKGFEQLQQIYNDPYQFLVPA